MRTSALLLIFAVTLFGCESNGDTTNMAVDGGTQVEMDGNMNTDAAPTLDGETEFDIDSNVSTDAAPTLDGETPTDDGIVVDSGMDAEAVDPVTCEIACTELTACLIAECGGFSQGAETQLQQRCVELCTPAQAQSFTTQTCAENIAQLRSERPSIADACRPTDDMGDGMNMLYIGHSFGRNFAERLPEVTSNVGIQNHRSNIVFSGGASGAPLALWDNEDKRREAQAILDGGGIELMVMICCSLPWLETGDDPGIENWMNYALEQNPNTRFGLAMPWIDFPESYDSAAEYSELWAGAYLQWLGTVDALRVAYPNVEIFAIPHGRASGDLMTLFEMDALPEVAQLRGPSNSSIFVDQKGHAGQILKDMGALIWLGAIYGVDVSGYTFDRGYTTDISGMAHTIVSEDDYTRQP